MNAYQGPMQPYPGLEAWARETQLPGRGIKLYFYDTDGGGQQPPVLLLHGLGDEADTWRHILPALAQAGWRALAPDLPGFGRSDKGKLAYSIPFFAETMRSLLDQARITRVILVGHSTGAVIAHQFALQYPERVARLVLIGGSLVAPEGRPSLDLLLFMLPGVGEWLYSRLRKDPEAAYASLQGYYHDLNALPQSERDFLYRRVNQRVWSDGQRRGFLSTLRGLASWLPKQQRSLPEQLRAWDLPTTLVWGAEDRIVPVAGGQALARLLPSARLVIVPEAGHNVQQEKPESVIQAITGQGENEAI